MEIREIKDKKTWEDFLISKEHKTFLQSWNWGEFQQLMKNKVWRLGIYEKELIGIALVIKIKAKRGTFLLIQHGPVFKKGFEKSLGLFLKELKKIAEKEKASFIRLNPLWEENSNELLKSFNLRPSPIQENSYESTLKLDLSLSEDQLFRNLRKTTRYLIRKTQNNKNIIIEKSNDVLAYQGLNKKVGQRQGFIPFSFEYIKNEFEVFSKDNQAIILLGKHNEEIACGALIIFWSNIAFYHQAASDEKFMKLSIPYLLQWEAIKEAKKRGCLFYDFWGYVDPKKYPKHPWAGPTLFKLGYNGKPIEYIKTQDYIISQKYWLTYFFEKLRRKKRRI